MSDDDETTQSELPSQSANTESVVVESKDTDIDDELAELENNFENRGQLGEIDEPSPEEVE